MYAGIVGQMDWQSGRNREPPSHMADGSGCSEENRICGHCRNIGKEAWSQSVTVTVCHLQ